MVVCLVSLGANLGKRRQTLDEAVAQIRSAPAVRHLTESARLETEAIGGPPDQPMFLNSVVRFQTEAKPLELLAILQAIEHDSQRDRQERWAARTLDLDLLAYGDQVLREPALCVPHPRMSYRPFVLEPAASVAPDWPHPELGKTLAQLLQTLRHGRNVVRLEGAPHEDPMGVAQLLETELARTGFSGRTGFCGRAGVVIEPGATAPTELPPRLTIDLHRQPAVLQGSFGPRLRLADCEPEQWQAEVRAAMGCVWPELTE